MADWRALTLVGTQPGYAQGGKPLALVMKVPNHVFNQCPNSI
jgi:hypothetical protein